MHLITNVFYMDHQSQANNLPWTLSFSLSLVVLYYVHWHQVRNGPQTAFSGNLMELLSAFCRALIELEETVQLAQIQF